MAGRCNCEQLNRQIFSGELLTIHGKLCPAREDELRILLTNVDTEFKSLESESRVHERVRQVIGLGIITSLPPEKRRG